MVCRAARAGSAPGKELEVIEAMAAIINQDASRPYDFLYFESDFSAATTRRQLHGESGSHAVLRPLARSEAQSLVTELESVNTSPWHSTRTWPGTRA